MTVITTTKDPQTLTLTLVAEFDAPPARVWSVWEDPRKLERWWGPPGWPATFTRHDFVEGGESRYYMTGPAGERHFGFWHMVAIDEPARIDFVNGLARADGEPDPDIPGMVSAAIFEPAGGGTRMTAISHFVDLPHMEKMLEMGMAEGMTQAIGQIDGLVAASVGAR